MEANQEFGLDEVVLTSHVPESSNAYFKDIKDMQFYGIPDHYTNCNMARTQAS